MRRTRIRCSERRGHNHYRDWRSVCSRQRRADLPLAETKSIQDEIKKVEYYFSYGWQFPRVIFYHQLKVMSFDGEKSEIVRQNKSKHSL